MPRARRQRQDGFRPKLIALSVAACFTLSANQSLANPSGGTVASGSASFTAAGNTLTITNSANAIINWASFSIGVNEITRFLQSSSASAVLNRVVGSGGVIPQSVIDGILSSNGRVFLLNQSGVIVGRTATIDAAGFVASSLNLTDQDFLNGRMNFNAQPGTNPGKVSNAGLIDTTNAGPGGRVFLIAPDVENSGIIRTPQGQIVLAAGSSVELVQESSPFVTVKLTAGNEQALNMGSLISDSGRIDMAGALVRNSGVVSANSAVVGANGEIRLVATKDVTLDAGSTTTANGPSGGKVLIQAQGGTALVYGNVSATGSSGTGGTVQALGVRVGVLGNGVIDASGQTGGGTVLVGGDQHGANPNVQNAQQTLIGPDAIIRADAGATGDGGRVIVWSDQFTQFYGNISARGGAQSGNGGFVETSGEHGLVFAGLVDTRAPNGATGSLLLDPDTITITYGGGANSNLASGATFTSLDGTNPATITDATINQQLNLSSVTILTGTGDINIDSTGVAIQPITLAGAPTLNDNTLTLQSGASINWTGSWSYTNGVSVGGGALTLNAPNGGMTGGAGTLAVNGTAPLILNAGNGSINLNGSIVTQGGAVAITTDPTLFSIGGGTAAAITTYGGSVALSAANVSVGDINTAVYGGDASPTNTFVSIIAGNGSIATGAITTGSVQNFGESFVSLQATNGGITAGAITTGTASDNEVDLRATTTGAITINGAITTASTIPNFGGGSVLITTGTGDITVYGNIDTHGISGLNGQNGVNSGTNGGSVTLQPTSGSVGVYGAILTYGGNGTPPDTGDGGGGGSAGPVTISSLSACEGCFTAITGDIYVRDGIVASGGSGGNASGIGSGGFGGSGGDVNLYASGNVTIGGVNGGSVDASGGTGGNAFSSVNPSFTGGGGGGGGSIHIESGQALTVNGSVLASGGAGGSGAYGGDGGEGGFGNSVFLAGSSSINIASDILAQGGAGGAGGAGASSVPGGNGGFGGNSDSVTLSSGGSVVVGGSIDVSGGAGGDGSAGNAVFTSSNQSSSSGGNGGFGGTVQIFASSISAGGIFAYGGNGGAGGSNANLGGAEGFNTGSGGGGGSGGFVMLAADSSGTPAANISIGGAIDVSGGTGGYGGSGIFGQTSSSATCCTSTSVGAGGGGGGGGEVLVYGSSTSMVSIFAYGGAGGAGGASNHFLYYGTSGDVTTLAGTGGGGGGGGSVTINGSTVTLTGTIDVSGGAGGAGGSGNQISIAGDISSFDQNFAGNGGGGGAAGGAFSGGSGTGSDGGSGSSNFNSASAFRGGDGVEGGQGVQIFASNITVGGIAATGGAGGAGGGNSSVSISGANNSNFTTFVSAGGNGGQGGSVLLAADQSTTPATSISVTGTIDVSGGTGGAGSSYGSFFAGSGSFAAQPDAGGSGAEGGIVGLYASTSIGIANINAYGGAGGNAGDGNLSIIGGNGGNGGFGGVVLVNAGTGTITSSGTINVSGGNGGNGGAYGGNGGSGGNAFYVSLVGAGSSGTIIGNGGNGGNVAASAASGSFAGNGGEGAEADIGTPTVGATTLLGGHGGTDLSGLGTMGSGGFGGFAWLKNPSGNISIAGAISAYGGLDGTGVQTSQSGSVEIDPVNGSVTQSAAIVADFLDVFATGTGNVTLTNTGNIIGSTSAFNNSEGPLNGSFSLFTNSSAVPGAQLTPFVDVVATGDVLVQSGNSIDATHQLNLEFVQSTGGSVTAVADTIGNGDISAATFFQYYTNTPTNTITLNSLPVVSAPLTIIGSTNPAQFSGNIVVNSPVSGGNLSLVTSGNGVISQAGGAGISVMSLNAYGGTVTLTDPTNNVGTLQGGSPNSFSFTNAGPLTIATVDTVSGAPAGLSGNSVTLAAVGGIGQTAPVTVGSLSVSDSAGDINLINSANSITNLTVSSPGNVSVENGSGSMNVVTASAGPNLSLVSDSITASGAMTATNIFYTTANPAAVISPPSSFFTNAIASVIELGDPTLSNTGGISLSGATPNSLALDLLTSGPVSSSGAISVPTLVALGSSVSLSTANNVTTFVGTASAGNLAFTSTGSVSVAAAASGNVTLTSGGDLAGGAANGGTTSLTAAGAIGAPGSPFGVVATGLGAQAANGITIEMTSANGLPVPVSQLQNTATGDILLNAHGGVITNSLVQNNGGDVTINTFSPMTISAGIDAAGSIFLCTGGPACSPGGTATTGGVNNMTLTGPFTFNTATGQFDVTIGPTGDLTLIPALSVSPLVLTAELFPNPFDITKFVFIGASTLLPQVQLGIDTSTNSTNQLSNQQGTVDTGDNQQKQDDKKKGAATCK